MDELTGENNTKQKDGAIGYLTKGVVKRAELYVPAVLMALVPFLNKDLFANAKDKNTRN